VNTSPESTHAAPPAEQPFDTHGDADSLAGWLTHARFISSTAASDVVVTRDASGSLVSTYSNGRRI
jgi:hypothetical protein